MAPRSKPASRKKHSKLKNYLFPHEGNGYHPKLFRRAAVATLVLAIVLFEGAYVLDTKLALNREGFLASVLPAALLDLTNADRTQNGVAPLQNDPVLAEAAQMKADDMAAKGYFAHVSPDGKTPWYWLDQLGYDYVYAGENLAVNFDDSSAVEDAWMNSPTHRANIVKPQYTRVGFAVAHGTYKGKETTFVVQDFASTPSDATVTATPKPANPVSNVVEKVVAVVTPSRQEKPEAVPAAAPAPLSGEAPAVAGSQEAPAVTDAAPDDSGQPMILAKNTSETIRPDASSASFLKTIAASPLRTSIYVLGGLIVLMLMSLAFALTAHAKARTLEVLGGGAIVIAFALSVLVYNATHALSPVVPTQAAATAAASR